MPLAAAAALGELLAPELAPLPDEAYRPAPTPILTSCDRRLAMAEGRIPEQGWRAELDITTEAAEGRLLGRLDGRGTTLAAYARREWESGESEAGVRLSVPMGRRRKA